MQSAGPVRCPMRGSSGSNPGSKLSETQIDSDNRASLYSAEHEATDPDRSGRGPGGLDPFGIPPIAVWLCTAGGTVSHTFRTGCRWWTAEDRLCRPIVYGRRDGEGGAERLRGAGAVGGVKAAVLEEIGAPLRVQELTLEAPRAGEVLVRVEAAGVCHSDYHYMTGDLRCPLPVVVGHEGAGVVEAVGREVSSVGLGDRVAMLWRPRCGRCAYCVAGQPVMCELGRVQAMTGGLPDDGTTRLRRDGHEVHHLMGVSCFAERAVVSEKSVVKITEGVPSKIAAITGCAVITGVGAVLNVVGECAGRPLLVLGAGGVGLSAVMGARLVGAEPVIAAISAGTPSEIFTSDFSETTAYSAKHDTPMRW